MSVNQRLLRWQNSTLMLSFCRWQSEKKIGVCVKLCTTCSARQTFNETAINHDLKKEERAQSRAEGQKEKTGVLGPPETGSHPRFRKKRGLLACRLYVEGQHCVCVSARRVHRLVAQHHVDTEVGVAEQVTLQHVDRQSLTRAGEGTVKK